MFTNLMEKSAKMKPEEVDHRSVSKILNYLSKEEISHFKQYFRQFLSILKSKSTGLDENCLLIILKADIQNRDEDAKAGSILEKLSRILLQKQDLSITFLKELIDHFKLHNDRNSQRIEELAYDKAIQKANNTYLSSSEIIELFHILRKTLDLKTANCIKDSIRKNSFTHLESFDLVNMISKIMVADAGYLKRFSSIIPDSFLIKLDRKEVQELSVSEIIKILNRIYTTQNYQSLASYTELLKEKLISDLLLPSLMQEFIDLLTYFELPEIVLEEIKYVQPLVYEFLTINKPYNLLSIATKLRYCDLEHWEQFVEMNFQSFSDEDILDFTQKCDSISAIN